MEPIPSVSSSTAQETSQGTTTTGGNVLGESTSQQASTSRDNAEGEVALKEASWRRRMEALDGDADLVFDSDLIECLRILRELKQCSSADLLIPKVSLPALMRKYGFKLVHESLEEHRDLIPILRQVLFKCQSGECIENAVSWLRLFAESSESGQKQVHELDGVVSFLANRMKDTCLKPSVRCEVAKLAVRLCEGWSEHQDVQRLDELFDSALTCILRGADHEENSNVVTFALQLISIYSKQISVSPSCASRIKAALPTFIRFVNRDESTLKQIQFILDIIYEIYSDNSSLNDSKLGGDVLSLFARMFRFDDFRLIEQPCNLILHVSQGSIERYEMVLNHPNLLTNIAEFIATEPSKNSWMRVIMFFRKFLPSQSAIPIRSDHSSLVPQAMLFSSLRGYESLRWDVQRTLYFRLRTEEAFESFTLAVRGSQSKFERSLLRTKLSFDGTWPEEILSTGCYDDRTLTFQLAWILMAIGWPDRIHSPVDGHIVDVFQNVTEPHFRARLRVLRKITVLVAGQQRLLEKNAVTLPIELWRSVFELYLFRECQSDLVPVDHSSSNCRMMF